MELHGIICGQGHTQALVQELPQRIFGVFQEQAVVAEWRHCNWHLGQIVQVLQHRALREHKGYKINTAQLVLSPYMKALSVVYILNPIVCFNTAVLSCV